MDQSIDTPTAAPALTIDLARTATVILFKASGKYYTTESWRVPDGAVGPWDMEESPDFRRIEGGAVLVAADADTGSFPNDENWGYPQLLIGRAR